MSPISQINIHKRVDIVILERLLADDNTCLSGLDESLVLDLVWIFIVIMLLSWYLVLATAHRKKNKTGTEVKHCQ